MPHHCSAERLTFRGSTFRDAQISLGAKERAAVSKVGGVVRPSAALPILSSLDRSGCQAVVCGQQSPRPRARRVLSVQSTQPRRARHISRKMHIFDVDSQKIRGRDGAQAAWFRVIHVLFRNTYASLMSTWCRIAERPRCRSRRCRTEGQGLDLDKKFIAATNR